MNKIILGLCALLFTACQDIPPDMSDRVALLESQAALDRANYSLLVTRVSVLESRMDDADVAMVALNGVVAGLSANLAGLTSSYSTLSTAQSGLMDTVGSLALDISSLSGSLAAKMDQAGTINLINTALSSYATTAQLNLALTTNGAQIYQCRNGSVVSKEKILKVNGTFYAVMNYVSKQTINYVNTTGAATSVNVPGFCSNGYNDWLAYNSGSCTSPNVYTPAQNVSVAAGTSTSISVVTGVQMALEPLTSGTSYVTTDNSTPCYFNGNGTNLEML